MFRVINGEMMNRGTRSSYTDPAIWRCTSTDTDDTFTLGLAEQIIASEDAIIVLSYEGSCTYFPRACSRNSKPFLFPLCVNGMFVAVLTLLFKIACSRPWGAISIKMASLGMCLEPSSNSTELNRASSICQAGAKYFYSCLTKKPYTLFDSLEVKKSCIIKRYIVSTIWKKANSPTLESTALKIIYYSFSPFFKRELPFMKEKFIDFGLKNKILATQSVYTGPTVSCGSNIRLRAAVDGTAWSSWARREASVEQKEATVQLQLVRVAAEQLGCGSTRVQARTVLPDTREKMS
nr:unnamed protein product [Callosobruchus chinensis]